MTKTKWNTPVDAFVNREDFLRLLRKDLIKTEYKYKGIVFNDLGANENGLWWTVWTEAEICLYSYDITARFRINHELDVPYETEEIEYIGVIYDEDDHCIAEIAVSMHLYCVLEALVNHTKEQFETFGTHEIIDDEFVEDPIVSEMRDALESKFEDDNDFDCFG